MNSRYIHLIIFSILIIIFFVLPFLQGPVLLLILILAVITIWNLFIKNNPKEILKPNKMKIAIFLVLMGVSLYLTFTGVCFIATLLNPTLTVDFLPSENNCNIQYNIGKYIIPVTMNPVFWFGLPPPIYVWPIVVVYWYMLAIMTSSVIEYIRKKK